ncbi:hypothetical protein AMTRI_Chr05g58880 [Amborella trichopoda]
MYYLLSYEWFLDLDSSSVSCFFCWYVQFFLISSRLALNLMLLAKRRTIAVLELVSWPINLLLLICASKLVTHFLSNKTGDQSLSLSLRSKTGQKETNPSGGIGFSSRLTFSWVDPLLRLGYSKPLALEDVPSLESEDEATNIESLCTIGGTELVNTPTQKPIKRKTHFIILLFFCFLIIFGIADSDLSRLAIWQSDTDLWVAQTAWIQSGTIRDNILYGKPMNKTSYENAIRVCALDKDLENFDHSDLPEIGERGLNLSGGQKQRIQLARAVYNDADIYLLDDPFSAVDAHTAAILFNDCVKKALEKKTVILVTHQVELLAEDDEIMVLEGGKITQSGSYNDLLRTGMEFGRLVNAHQEAMTALENPNKQGLLETHKQGLDSPNSFPFPKGKSEVEIETNACSPIQLTNEEEKEIGDVGWKPYMDYIILLRVLFLFFLLKWFSSIPVHSNLLAGSSCYSSPDYKCNFNWSIHWLSILSIVFVYFRALFITHLGLRASKAFFTGFMDSVFQAPMLFFDSTAIGRILTRASSDMGLLDFDIPYAINFCMCPLLDLILILIIMCIVTWKVLVVVIPRYHLSSARELVRLNGSTKAPVVNYAAETSLGVVTIRAFSVMERFIHQNLKLIDTDARVFFYTNAAMECNYIISVERLKQFMNLPLEPAAIVDDHRPPHSWPVKGRIDLQDLNIKYRLDSPLVLKGITCTFEAGKRVEVVGRTGSGKTTLLSALFRLVEQASGKILIDGLDICSIGLRDLRNKLSIIPQEQTLFKGTIRSNLDPLGAIEKCQLKTTIQGLPNLLDSTAPLLLKKNKILVLDEATASTDSATDFVLQKVIRKEFSNCTVITVAHRVPTVTDSDLAMVLSYGKLLEYDKPSGLMETNSSFAKLVDEYWANCNTTTH